MTARQRSRPFRKALTLTNRHVHARAQEESCRKTRT